MTTGFTWRDGERRIRFGRGALADAPALLGDGYTLLTTERAAAAAPGIVAATGHTLHVGPGRVDELAGEAARLIAGAWDAGEPDRDALALGALLSGYVIDATGYGLHHVASQTLVRLAGVGHGPANAAMLPHTLAALRRRAPERLDRLG